MCCVVFCRNWYTSYCTQLYLVFLVLCFSVHASHFMRHVRSTAVINWADILSVLFPVSVLKMSTLMKKRKMSYKNATLATKVAKLQRQVASSKPEIKQQNGTVTMADGTTAFYSPIITIAQGTGANNRIGDEIRIHKIVVRSLGSAVPQGHLELFTVKSGQALLTPGADATPLGDLDRSLYTSLANTYINTSKCPSVGGNNTISVSKKFSIPMKVSYAGASTTAVTNQVYLRWCNATGQTPVTAQSATYSIYFTDN